MDGDEKRTSDIKNVAGLASYFLAAHMLQMLVLKKVLTRQEARHIVEHTIGTMGRIIPSAEERYEADQFLGSTLDGFAELAEGQASH